MTGPGDSTLRRADEADDEFLRALYATTRADELDAVPWPAEQKTAFLSMQFEAQHSDYSTRFPAAHHSIVLLAGAPVGRIWVDRRPDEIRLLDIALLPEHQNAGVGAELLRRLQSEAALAGVALRHSVAKNNPDGLRFYRRLGFTVVEDWEMHDLMEWLPGQVEPTSRV